jgi:hypothetical protein
MKGQNLLSDFVTIKVVKNLTVAKNLVLKILRIEMSAKFFDYFFISLQNSLLLPRLNLPM